MVYQNQEAKSVLARPSELQWLSHVDGSSKRYSTKDVSISLLKAGERCSARFNITLRNGSSEKLGQRIDIAVVKNRMFFRGGELGYKLYVGQRTNPMLQITLNDNTKILEQFVGDYDLQYDEFYELYYIEKN